jgi:hypothetical protein
MAHMPPDEEPRCAGAALVEKHGYGRGAVELAVLDTGFAGNWAGIRIAIEARTAQLLSAEELRPEFLLGMNDRADQEIFVFFGVKDIMRLVAVAPETGA